MREDERPPTGFRADPYLEPAFEFPEWFERMLRADMLLCMRDCVEDLSVLWLFLKRLLAELISLVPLPLLLRFMVELTETHEFPRVFEPSSPCPTAPDRVPVVSLFFCEPRVIGRLILQQMVTSL